MRFSFDSPVATAAASLQARTQAKAAKQTTEPRPTAMTISSRVKPRRMSVAQPADEAAVVEVVLHHGRGADPRRRRQRAAVEPAVAVAVDAVDAEVAGLVVGGVPQPEARRAHHGVQRLV